VKGFDARLKSSVVLNQVRKLRVLPKKRLGVAIFIE
jgi:hypothetical protein